MGERWIDMAAILLTRCIYRCTRMAGDGHVWSFELRIEDAETYQSGPDLSDRDRISGMGYNRWEPQWKSCPEHPAKIIDILDWVTLEAVGCWLDMIVVVQEPSQVVSRAANSLSSWGGQR